LSEAGENMNILSILLILSEYVRDRLRMPAP